MDKRSSQSIKSEPIKLEPIKPVQFPSSKKDRVYVISEVSPPKSTKLVIAEMKKLSKQGIYCSE